MLTNIKKLYIVFLLLILALPSSVFAAIAFDARSATTIADLDPVTFSHTTSGLNRFLVVAISTTNDVVVGVTYGGVSMTQSQKVTGIQGSLATNGVGYIYTLDDPAEGANDVSIDVSATGNNVRAAGISYNGVDSLDTSVAQTDTGTALSSTLTVGDDQSFVVFVATANGGGDITASTNVTERGTGNGTMFLGDSNGGVSPGSFNQLATAETTEIWMSGQVSLAPFISPSKGFGDIILFGDW